MDNPKTNCRELIEVFSSSNTEAPNVMLSVPKAAVDQKLCVFWKPWGAYFDPMNLQRKTHRKNANSGVRRTPEEEEVMISLFEQWEARDPSSPVISTAFWQKHVVPVMPTVTHGAFYTFCKRRRQKLRIEAGLGEDE